MQWSGRQWQQELQVEGITEKRNLKLSAAGLLRIQI